MKGLSKNEIVMIANLEFTRKYFFTQKDVQQYFSNHRQMINTFYTLRKKGRIFRLSKQKYFLVPIKAPKGKWTDHPLIITDEMFSGEDYVVGGWYAAHYLGLTEQIPMQVDIWTTKRQGTISMLNSRFVFHRTTAERIKKMSLIRRIGGHLFRIMNKRATKKWFQSKE